MNKEEMLRTLEDIFEMDEGELKGDEPLSAVEGWDSMAALSIIAMFDSKLSLSINAKELKNVQKVSDIIRLAGL